MHGAGSKVQPAGNFVVAETEGDELDEFDVVFAERDVLGV